MRVFVAVFPPLEIRLAVIAEALEKLRPLDSRSGDQVRWTRPENVHLTLKFLGDIREEVLADLCTVLEKICLKHSPFSAGLAGLGAFPSARRARILWAGVSAGSDRLRSLAAEIDDALAPLGFEREKRPYAPHLTVGRVRGRPAGFELPPSTKDLEFQVRSIELVQSTLTPEGAVYKIVETFALGEKEKKLENEPKGDEGTDGHEHEE